MTVGQFFDATATALDQQAADGDPNAANAAAELPPLPDADGRRQHRTRCSSATSSTSSRAATTAAADGSINVLDLAHAAAPTSSTATTSCRYQFGPDDPRRRAVANVDQYTVVRADRRLRTSGSAARVENSQVRLQVNLQVAAAHRDRPRRSRSPWSSRPPTRPARSTGLDCADPLTVSEAEIDVTTSGRHACSSGSDQRPDRRDRSWSRRACSSQGGASLLNSRDVPRRSG